MTRNIATLFLITSSFLIASIHAAPISIIGDDSYPPYSFKSNKGLDGIYTEIIKEALKKLPEHKAELKGLPWKRGLADLESGSINALFPPYKREKERPYMVYSVPIFEEKVVIFCNDKYVKDNAKFPDDFKGLKFGLNLGFLLTDAFNKARTDKVIKVQESKGSYGNVKKLVTGRIDCYINDRYAIFHELKRLKAEGVYKGSGVKEALVMKSEWGYLAYTASKQDAEPVKSFRPAFDKVIEEMKKSGEIQKIAKKYTE